MKRSTDSASIADAISNFLTGVGLDFSFDDRRGQFKFGLRLKGKISKVKYIIDIGENEYIVYVVSSVYPNSNNRRMMHSLTEFLCRANYNMASTNFEINMTSGEIRMRYFVDCDDIAPTIGLVKRSICSPGLMFERYGDGIADIILDHVTAKEAIDRCERPPIQEQSISLDGQADEDDKETEMIIDRLEKRMGHFQSEAANGTSWDAGVPKHIRIDLFGTEGGTGL